MSLRHQTSILTKQKVGGYTHTLRYSFFVRMVIIAILLAIAMVLTIGTDLKTQSLFIVLSSMGDIGGIAGGWS